MKNEELVTKEELLELGFEYDSYTTDGVYIESYALCFHNLELFINLPITTICLVNSKGVLIFETKATKANMLKLIEITKLIGELE